MRKVFFEKLEDATRRWVRCSLCLQLRFRTCRISRICAVFAHVAFHEFVHGAKIVTVFEVFIADISPSYEVVQIA